ncbi:MAG: bifunctional nuclease family protein [Verrucomicrobia bacterium]|nr:bifunctional nuclease family protein [Verrucomicrobiota bacterium]
MIAVKVDQLFLSNMGFVVILKGGDDDRAVPIFIGAAEAQAIAIQLQGVKVPRPLTHDLLKNVFDYLECRIKRIEVCDLQEGTYFGKLIVELGKNDMEIDCRPSDAIALALRASAPIFVHEKVMEEAGRILENIQPDAEGEAPPEAPEERKPLSPIEILNHKLDRAVADERYEDAARFRDEINRLKKHTDN